MSQQQLSSILEMMFQAFVQSVPLALAILAGLVLIAFGVVLVRKLILGWRNKVMQNAVTLAVAVADKKANEYLTQEMTRFKEIELRAQIAAGEKQYAVQLALHCVWEKHNELYFAMHGTSQKSYEPISEFLHLLGLPMPEMKLKESYRPFMVQLMAICKALFHLGSMVDAGRVELSDIERYSGWLDELKDQWQRFVSDEDWENHSIEMRLTILRECHADLGQAFGLEITRAVPAFTSFLGTLHVLEELVEEKNFPSNALWPHVDALDTPLWRVRSALALKQEAKAAAEDVAAEDAATEQPIAMPSTI